MVSSFNCMCNFTVGVKLVCVKSSYCYNTVVNGDLNKQTLKITVHLSTSGNNYIFKLEC